MRSTRGRRGNMILEAVLFLPLLLLLLIGMIEIAEITYTYYTLQRTMYSIARQVATSQAVDFCDSADATIVGAKNFVLTGTSDGSAESFLPALQAEQISVEIERYDATTGELGACMSLGVKASLHSPSSL